MTKAELEKENKALKAKIRELQKENKVVQELSEDLTDLGYGVVVLDEVGKKRLASVKINFNLKKNCAIIDADSIEPMRDFELANYLKRKVVDEILKRKKEI